MLNPVENVDPNEPAELRMLSKAQIYKMLSSEWALPAKESRGVSRAYLVNVYRAQVYRVDRIALQTFEARLVPGDMIRSTFFSMSVSFERLASLMQILGQPQLGFTPTNLPDEAWFLRIARYVDQFNILRIFRSRLPQAARPPILPARM